MKRIFIETDLFKRLLDNEPEQCLEKRIKDQILKYPFLGDVIQGTGGLRKIRVAKSGYGKSGGYRVIYLDLESFGVVYLLLIYEKNVHDDLSSKQRQALKRQVEEIKNEYHKKSYKR